MKRLEKKLNVNDFDPENILSSKEMRGIVGGYGIIARRLTSTTHLCQIQCSLTPGQAIIRKCDEGECIDGPTFTSCMRGSQELFTISC